MSVGRGRNHPEGLEEIASGTHTRPVPNSQTGNPHNSWDIKYRRVLPQYWDQIFTHLTTDLQNESKSDGLERGWAWRLRDLNLTKLEILLELYLRTTDICINLNSYHCW